MSLGHSEVSFNHSCLKVPLNSSSRRPVPKYERLSSAKNSKTKQKENKKECLSDISNFTSVKKYLEFYESIPDYSELHHLSNEEFYSRLKSLKITQKRLSSEEGLWSSVNSEDDISSEKYSWCFGDREIKKDSEIRTETCASSMCCTHKINCGIDDFCKLKTTVRDDASFGTLKQPPPKINIISDNENASDLYEPESKKHSDYEADQESSTLQVGEKPGLNGLKNQNIEDECLGTCSRRSRSLPVSPACECEPTGLCHGFCDVIFRNERRRNTCSTSKQSSQSLTKKSKKFQTRPIPLTSRIPLFDKIMFEKEARRRAIHDLYSEELRSSVKPFSFTKREEQKERLRMVSSNPELTSVNPTVVRFKAKPVPKNLFSNYAYERMKEDEFYRALKRRVRAEEMLKSSSLPPSMALREKKFRSKSLDFLDYRSPKRTWNKTCGYRRACKNIRKEIEFDEKMKNETPQKRKHRSTWMSSNRRINSATDSSAEISPYESILNPERRRNGRPHSAFSCSRNNLASVLRIETARKRLEKEMEEKLNECRLKHQAKLKAHLARMDPAWRALRCDKNEDLALRMAARRQEDRLKQETHRRLMESMYGRVYSMPPLFHKERFSNEKNPKFHNCSGEKNVAGFPYNESSEKLENEAEKDSKPRGFSSSFRDHENCRSRESSESAGSCEKNEKKKLCEREMLRSPCSTKCYRTRVLAPEEQGPLPGIARVMWDSPGMRDHSRKGPNLFPVSFKSAGLSTSLSRSAASFRMRTSSAKHRASCQKASPRDMRARNPGKLRTSMVQPLRAVQPACGPRNRKCAAEPTRWGSLLADPAQVRCETAVTRDQLSQAVTHRPVPLKNPHEKHLKQNIQNAPTRETLVLRSPVSERLKDLV